MEVTSLATLIEAIITYYKEFFTTAGGAPWEMVISLILGIVVAVAYKLDLLAHFNLNSRVPYVGNVLTGILLSRGSNYIFDLISNLSY